MKRMSVFCEPRHARAKTQTTAHKTTAHDQKHTHDGSTGVGGLLGWVWAPWGRARRVIRRVGVRVFGPADFFPASAPWGHVRRRQGTAAVGVTPDDKTRCAWRCTVGAWSSESSRRGHRVRGRGGSVWPIWGVGGVRVRPRGAHEGHERSAAKSTGSETAPASVGGIVAWFWRGGEVVGGEVR